MEKISGFYKQSIDFLRDVRSEVKKVTWPTRKETLASTGVVVIAVLIVAIYLGLVDLGFSKLVGSIIR
ncbi:MAG: preprotein translocase subunit SecE [Nitrospinota bacterium]|jgi:preprotein translocase subunit SecE|nr:preprotein translocase subunit SecE [Nitrospinota bacterium]HJM43018.1 preprotein translocase subunit SecE [Nitrospinota bacterium]